MQIDILKHTIVNTVKSISFRMPKPEKKFMRTILENMLEYKTTVLSQLGNTEEKSAKQWLKYYSTHLGKSSWNNLGEKVEKIMVKFIGKLDKESVFCFDTVDINKNSSQQMEGIKKIRDGSKGTFGNGFIFHGVSIKSIPLFLHRERLKNHKNDKWIKFEIFEKQVRKIVSIFGLGHRILADRGYDDMKNFKLLVECGFKFSIRLKTNRNLKMIEGEQSGQTVQAGTLRVGSYSVQVKGIKETLYIFVEKSKGHASPIRIISNVNNSHVVKKYLERWEIERVFKVGKQEFNFEKIGTENVQKTENLAYLVQLCLGISAYIFNKLSPRYEYGISKNETITYNKIHKKIRPFLKRKSLTFNRNSITNFLGYYMRYIKNTKTFFGKTTLKRGLIAQLSLNL